MLSSTVSRTTATGSDSTPTYNYNFRIFLAADLLVTVRNTTTNAESKLTLTTDYTVNDIGQASGTISLVSAGQAWIDTSSGDLLSNYIIVIRRVRPLTQNVYIRNQGTYYASVHEDEFDNLIMIDQQHWDQISRSMRLPETVTPDVFNPYLPVGIDQAPAGASLVVNQAGNGWALGAPVAGWSSVTLSYAQLAAAALTNQITAFSLPAGCILMGLALKHSVVFAGTSITDVYLDVGTSGTPDLFLTDFDVYQSVSDTAFTNAIVQSIQSFVNATNIMIRATSVGANLSALSQGTVTLYYWYMNLNQGA